MYNKFSKGETVREEAINSSFPHSGNMEMWKNSERRVYNILERPVRNLFENSNETSFTLNELQKTLRVGHTDAVLQGLKFHRVTIDGVLYTTLTPGIFVCDKNIYSVYPTPYTATRQLEEALGLNNFDGKDKIAIFYEDGKFNAEIVIGDYKKSILNKDRGIVLLNEIVQLLKTEIALPIASRTIPTWFKTQKVDSIVINEIQLEPCYIYTSTSKFLAFDKSAKKINNAASVIDFSFGTHSISTFTETTVIWSGVVTDSVKNNAVTNAKLNKMPALTVKANATGVSADTQDINEATLMTAFHMVNTLGPQTISGIKTFSTQPELNNNISVLFKGSAINKGWKLSNSASDILTLINEASGAVAPLTITNNGNFKIVSPTFTVEAATKTSITSPVAITGITTIDGATTITGATTVTGATDINGATTVTGKTIIKADGTNESFAVTGPTTISGTVGITGNTNITGTFTASGVSKIGTDIIATLTANQELTNKKINGLTITDSTGTLTISNGKTLTANDTTTIGTSAITLASGKVLTMTKAGLTVGDNTGTGNVTIKSDGTTARVLTLNSNSVINTNSKILTIENGNVTIKTPASSASTLELPTSLKIAAMGTANNILYVNAANEISSQKIVPVTNGGTGFDVYAVGDLVYASATNALSKLSKGSTGQMLVQGSNAPFWTTTTIPSTIAKGSILAANALNTLSAITSVTDNKTLINDAGVIAWNSVTGTGNSVRSTSPQFTTPSLGVATATTVNGLTITSAGAKTLTISNGKTLTVNKTLTLDGADSTTMTFPSASQNIVGTSIAQTLTNKTMSTSCTWSGETIIVARGGTGRVSVLPDALMTGNNEGNLKVPGPTLTATNLSFGDNDGIISNTKTNGTLTLSPVLKTTTGKLLEVTSGGLLVSGGATIKDGLQQIGVSNSSVGINGSLSIKLISAGSLIVSDSSDSILLAIGNDQKITTFYNSINTNAIANTGTITSTKKISSDTEVSSVKITNTSHETVVDDLNSKMFNENSIDNIAKLTTTNENLHILTVDSETGKTIRKIKYSGLPIANEVDGGGNNGLMSPEMLAHLNWAYTSVGGSDEVEIVSTVNGIKPTDSEGKVKTAGNVSLYSGDIKMTSVASDTTTVYSRISAIESVNGTQTTAIARLDGHTPSGIAGTVTNNVMLRNGTNSAWGKIEDKHLNSTITNVSPSTLTGENDVSRTLGANEFPVAFWNANANKLRRDNDLVFNTNDNSLSATTVFSRSSRKVKKDITLYDGSAFDTLDKIEVVSFHYIEDETQADKVGFIAEDAPTLVAGINNDKMDLGNCIGLLIKAVQELKQENEELREAVRNGNRIR